MKMGIIIPNIENQKKIKQYSDYHLNCILMPLQKYSYAFWHVYNGNFHVAIGFSSNAISAKFINEA